MYDSPRRSTSKCTIVLLVHSLNDILNWRKRIMEKICDKEEKVIFWTSVDIHSFATATVYLSVIFRFFFRATVFIFFFFERPTDKKLAKSMMLPACFQSITYFNESFRWLFSTSCSSEVHWKKSNGSNYTHVSLMVGAIQPDRRKRRE